MRTLATSLGLVTGLTVLSGAGSALAQEAGAPEVVTTESAAVEAERRDLDHAILVVARGMEWDASRSTATVTRVGRDEIRRAQDTHVGDVLRRVPGVYVVPDGPAGQFSRVFTRGSASTQTLFVVDGVPQNDATTGGGYDLNDLQTDGIGAVEVLRGSYGVLYGSEAIGGVVAVRTRRYRGPAAGSVLVEAGSFGTRRGRLEWGVGDGELDLGLTLGVLRTSGERSRENHRSRHVAGSLGYDLTPRIRFTTSGRWAQSRTESPFDFASTGPLPEDDNIERNRRTASWIGRFDFALSDHLDLALSTSVLDLESDFDNGPDGPTTIDPDFTPGSGDEFSVTRPELVSDSDEQDVRTRGQATWRIGDQLGWSDGAALDLTAGAEYLSQESESTVTSPNFNAVGSSTTRDLRTTRTDSLFALVGIGLPAIGEVEGAYVEFGARRDDHSIFGDETSRFAGVRLPVPVIGTVLRSSYGEGFRSPKPSELFDVFVGNAGLGPETSESFDVGVDQQLLDGDLLLSLTWFDLEVEGLIEYDATAITPARPFGQLVNRSSTRTRGWEAAAAMDLGRGFTLHGSGTIQNPRNEQTGAALVNRARHFGALGLAWTDDRWIVSLDGFYGGGLPNQGGAITYPEPDERRHPGRRRLVTLGASYQVNDSLRVFGRIDNLLDDDYVTTPTAPAGTPLGVFLGAELTF